MSSKRTSLAQLTRLGLLPIALGVSGALSTGVAFAQDSAASCTNQHRSMSTTVHSSHCQALPHRLLRAYC